MQEPRAGVAVFALLGGNPGHTLATFYAMSPANKAKWIRINDDLVMAMLFLNNSKNDDAKKELRRSYANGNKSAYQVTLEKMARLLSSQYAMTKGPHKKNTPYDSTRSRRKGADSDARTQELHLLGRMRWMRLRRSLRPNQHRPTLLVLKYIEF